jgi:hypothetical protein
MPLRQEDHSILVSEAVEAVALIEVDPLTLREMGWRYYR